MTRHKLTSFLLSVAIASVCASASIAQEPHVPEIDSLEELSLHYS